MACKLLADFLLIAHFAWILFMLAGFGLTVRGFFCGNFFERWLFRLVHLLGIVYVSLLAAAGRHCPLTVWEYAIRARCDSGLIYPGGFVARYIEKLVYPDVNPLYILPPTFFIAVFTLSAFIIKPPSKIKRLFSKNRRGQINL